MENETHNPAVRILRRIGGIVLLGAGAWGAAGMVANAAESVASVEKSFALAVPQAQSFAASGAAEARLQRIEFAHRNLSNPALREQMLSVLAVTPEGAGVVRGMAANTGEPVEMRRDALAALASAGALVRDDATLVFALCESPDASLAVAAFDALAVLDASRRDIAARLRKGLLSAVPAVRAAAIRAAARCAAGEYAGAELLAIARSGMSDERGAAAAALLAIARRDVKVAGLGGNPAAVALSLFAADDALAPAIAAGLLRIGEGLPAEFERQVLEFSDEKLAAVVAAYTPFPDRLDSNFLREVALGKKKRAAIAAITLLASRRCVKNNATLECLGKVLASGDAELVGAVLDNFSSDTEFAHVPGLGGNTEGVTNDRFSEKGSETSSVLADVTYDFQNTKRRVGAHIPRAQWPDIEKIIPFLGRLEMVSQDRAYDARLQSRAHEMLLLESGLPRMGDILRRLLDSAHAGGAQLAWQMAMRYYNDPRLMEIALRDTAGRGTPLPAALSESLPPFLVRDDDARTRALGSAGRRLATASAPQKQAAGMALLSAHGTPGDRSYIVRSQETGGVSFPAPWRSPDASVRRAACFALARLTPEFFARNAAAAVAADPDADVRATLPLAFFRTAFRREYRIEGIPDFAQWAPALPGVVLDAANAALLQRMAESDPDAGVRLLALHALLQHGQLRDAAPLLDTRLALSDSALFSSQISRSVAAARAVGASIPPGLEFFAQEAAPAAPPVLAIFLSQNRDVQREVFRVVGGLRETVPAVRVVFYFGDAASDAVLNALCQRFPVPPSQRAKPVLVFGAGVWYASDTAPDFARLCEIITCSEFGDGRRFAWLLSLPEATAADGESAVEPGKILSGDAEVAIEVANQSEKVEDESDLLKAMYEVSTSEIFIILVAAAIGIAILILLGMVLLNWWRELPTRRAEKARAAKDGRRKKGQGA